MCCPRPFCAVLTEVIHSLQLNYPEAAHVDYSQRTNHAYLAATRLECIISCLYNESMIYEKSDDVPFNFEPV